MFTVLLVLLAAAALHGLNYDNLLEDFPLELAASIPDNQLMEDPATFVSDAGVRRGRGGGGRGGARRQHEYILREEREYKDKVLDLMKQVLYAAREYMSELTPVLEKYRGDPGFRMKFIFNRLQQYTVDMRRIYTLGVRAGTRANVNDHLRLYQHLARKHVDVIYVVDHVIAAHDQYMATLVELQRQQYQQKEGDSLPPGLEAGGVPGEIPGAGELPPVPADLEVPQKDMVTPEQKAEMPAKDA